MSLPPTTEALFDDNARPYFLWWTDATVGQFKEHLASSDPEERAYWMGALLRMAISSDVHTVPGGVMRSVLRTIGSVVAGFVAASIVMMIVESINGRVLYPGLARAAEGVKDREVLRGIVASAPAGALWVVIAGWVLGGLAGGFVAARLSAQAPVGHALGLGVLLTTAGVANNLMIPPPLWFWVVSLAVLLPATYLGARLVARGKPS